jgi:transcriptional regulator of acetoin/glycerol metabolism
MTLEAVRSATEREHLVHTLVVHEWRMGETAAALGISRKTLWQKMRRLSIERP